MADLRIAIAGGGIGGLALAVSLRNAGFAPVILERSPELGRVQLGGSIHLWPNGNRALAQVGLYDAVRASVDDDAVVKHQTFDTSSGKRLSEWDLSEGVHGMPTLSVVRGDFHAVLARAAEDMIRLDCEVEGFEQDDAGVTVRHKGGEERFDVLIGADGLQSKVRAQIVGDAPYYAGYTTRIAIIPHRDPFVLNAIRVYFGSGARFVTWSVTGGRIYWETIVASPQGTKDPEGGHREAVLEKFGDWVQPIRQLVEATPEELIVQSDSYARRPAEHWGVGRVTMIGDAAHAMTNAAGQGGNQAVEDAVVLTRCLQRNDDPTAALREYETLRRKRAQKFVTRSKALAKMALVRGPVLVSGRNTFMRVMGRAAYKAHSEDMAYDVGTA